MKGKLIVIEGIDSSGKTTQLELLKNHFTDQKVLFETADFPQYQTSFYGQMIARFLRGEFGPLEHVDPHIISVIYAQDRGTAKEKMIQWLKEGKYVLSNRYATSNMAHQTGRVPTSKRVGFVKWLEELEYQQVGIPREDIVLFLDMPYHIAQKLMHNSSRFQAYRKGAKKDMVEKDTSYLEHSAATYQWLAKKFPHWTRIKCTDSKGQLLSRELIHEEIKKTLAKKGIIK
jgi:dTMP kinase